MLDVRAAPVIRWLARKILLSPLGDAKTAPKDARAPLRVGELGAAGVRNE